MRDGSVHLAVAKLLMWLLRPFGGRSGQTAGLAAGAGATFFCVSGALYATWSMLWAYRLRSLGRRHGVDSPRAVRAARNASPRNTSLVGQTVVAALAIVLAPGA